MDSETLKLVARAAAQDAAQEVAGGLRAQMVEGLAQLEGNIATHIEVQFQRHFGSMDPAQHIAQHSRLELFLRRIDDMQTGFWKNIGATFAKWLITALIATVAWWHFTGK